MVLTKPFDQVSGDGCWPCFKVNMMRNESDLQTYLRNVPLAQGLSA